MCSRWACAWRSCRVLFEHMGCWLVVWGGGVQGAAAFDCNNSPSSLQGVWGLLPRAWCTKQLSQLLGVAPPGLTLLGSCRTCLSFPTLPLSFSFYRISASACLCTP